MRSSPADPGSQELCYESAVRSLTLRWHGRQELASKLSRRGFEPTAVEAVLLRLQEERWIDDRRFAVAFATARMHKHIGPARIIRELRQRGIDPGMASSAVTEAAADCDDHDQHLSILCRKKLRLLRSRGKTDPEELRKKLIGFLLNQGYDYGEVSAEVESELRLRQKD